MAGAVRAAHVRFGNAVASRQKLGHDSEATMMRVSELELVEAARQCLDAYRAAENFDPAGNPIEPLPDDVLQYLSDHLGALTTGKLPKSFQVLYRKGAPKYGPAILSDIDAAILYANAATLGIIADPSPRQTICRMFGIAGRTYRKWREIADKKKTNTSRFCANVAPYEDADEYSDETRRICAELITALMEKSAEHYISQGRPDDVESARRLVGI